MITVHNSGPQVEGSFLLSLQRFELENISYYTVIVTSFIGFGAYSQSSLIPVIMALMIQTVAYFRF